MSRQDTAPIICMMYTTSPPDSQDDRTRLFFSPATASPQVVEGQLIFEVAVRYDARNRRVEPSTNEYEVAQLAWATPGEAHADHSVTARGTIPPQLYTGRIAAWCLSEPLCRSVSSRIRHDAGVFSFK